MARKKSKLGEQIRYDFPQISKLINAKALAKYPLYLRQICAKELVSCLKEKGVYKACFNECVSKLKARLDEEKRKDLSCLINASGVILHTNLGRSLHDERLINRALDKLTGYVNLEFDTNTGKRGIRGEQVISKLKLLFDCEDACLVNNNAAAVFLIINTLAKGREVIASRGELVEIGGAFRVPEVISLAGGIMKEVGTTNKTHLKDYEKAICDESAILLKTHKSNFTQSGFTSEVGIDELHDLGQEKGLISYFDLGSGFVRLSPKLGKNMPSVRTIMHKCDLLSFSADKLLGGVQAGIILGKSKFIKKLQTNQLFRMLRLDKTHMVLLNELLAAYLNKEYELIPTLKMLELDAMQIKKRAMRIASKIPSLRVEKCYSLVGGGTLCEARIESFGLVIDKNAKVLQKRLRQAGVIARMSGDFLLLDLRCVLEKDLARLELIIKKAMIYG